MPQTWPLAWLPPLLAHVVGSGPVPIGRLLLVGGALAVLNVGIMLFLQGRAERGARRDDTSAAADAPPPDHQNASLGSQLIESDQERAHGLSPAVRQLDPSDPRSDNPSPSR